MFVADSYERFRVSTFHANSASRTMVRKYSCVNISTVTLLHARDGQSKILESVYGFITEKVSVFGSVGTALTPPRTAGDLPICRFSSLGYTWMPSSAAATDSCCLVSWPAARGGRRRTAIGFTAALMIWRGWPADRPSTHLPGLNAPRVDRRPVCRRDQYSIACRPAPRPCIRHSTRYWRAYGRHLGRRLLISADRRTDNDEIDSLPHGLFSQAGRQTDVYCISKHSAECIMHRLKCP
jgi:hypothetical protein